MFDWLFPQPLPPGAKAPGFTASDEAGNQVHLAALHGKYVLLVFYPGDNTPVCTKQLCDLRDSWDYVKSRKVEVFGVNPKNAASHAGFRARHHYPFPLLVDKGRRIASLYKANGVFIRRTVYLIGPDGRIVFSKRGTPAPAEVLAAAPIAAGQA